MAEQTINRVRHLGVIMDGNRRWARRHMLQSVLRGHEQGIDTFVDLCTWCQEAGIAYLTVYAFSTENWKRSQEEVSGLFALMADFFRNQAQTCVERDTRMIIVGDRSRLAPDALETVRRIEEMTAHCKSLTVQVAINYGGRDEILRAVEAYASDVRAGKYDLPGGRPADGAEEAGSSGAPFPETRELTEEIFEQYLDTAGIPDIDLVIRTGGNRRLSNFFPWQTTYAEIYFTDILWPDFSQKDLQEALDYYHSIQINKGK